MHVLPTEPIGFFDVLVAVASLDLKVPILQKDPLFHPPQIASGRQSIHWQIKKKMKAVGV